MFTKIIFTKRIIILMCVVALLPFSVNADIEINYSESIKEFSTLNSFESNFERIKMDPVFITNRGVFPETTNDSERAKWSYSLSKCWLNLTKMSPSCSDLDEAIISYSFAEDFLIVDLDPYYREEINDSRIDEIYQKIDGYCEQRGISEVPVVFIWANINETFPLPDYGPEMFEEARKSSNFITTRGTMPVITEERKKREWTDLLVKGSHNDVKIDHYFLDGPVIGFGTSINGYLFVEFYSNTPEKVNETLIDEIYQVIDNRFEQIGISDVPVVFVFADIPVVDELPDEEMNQVGTSDLSGEENETAKKSPGFTSVILILSLLILMKVKS
ncbi:hypothetical protein [Methanolobus chelungpuianus]|uniref:Uncharacterized protein n=1 Tax=Methanolobus chelungpuianus TaxID=502115 RepID=A0AAE3KX99_9EURY|nr:hypothetical protein [Methanolobus chelungpuianus]MCQ6962826.1 hypothetical protein [Methanolobus chelungpuianus]